MAELGFIPLGAKLIYRKLTNKNQEIGGLELLSHATKYKPKKFFLPP